MCKNRREEGGNWQGCLVHLAQPFIALARSYSNTPGNDHRGWFLLFGIGCKGGMANHPFCYGMRSLLHGEKKEGGGLKKRIPISDEPAMLYTFLFNTNMISSQILSLT